jgi:sec-independent protein translocase protein TatC
MASEAQHFLDHLRELRKRLFYSCLAIIVGSIVSYYFYPEIIEFLSSPLQQFFNNNQTPIFYVTSLLEGFFTRFKFSLIAGVIVSLPFHLYQLMRFMFPGLNKNEKRLILYSLIGSFLLSSLGFYVSYFKLLPYSIAFLMSIDFIPKHVGLMLQFNQNIFYIFNFIVYTMLIFQFPIVLEILLYLNIISRKALLKFSRFAIVLIFFVSAIIAPDVVSQIGLALILVLLFYLTIFVAKLFKFGEA